MKLTLDHIQAKGIKDTSTFYNVQDPVVHINIGKIFLSTEKKNNCKTSADFDAVLIAEITTDHYNNNVPMEVEVWNEDTLGNKHIGRGAVGLKSAISAFGQHFSVVIPLKHYENNGKNKDGKPHGEVVVRAFLEGPPAVANEKAAAAVVSSPQPAAGTPAPAVSAPAPVVAAVVDPVAAPVAAPVSAPAPAKKAAVEAPPEAAPAPETAQAASSVTAPTARPEAKQSSPQVEYDQSKPLVLRIDQLQARDLKDKGSALDKQDPALRITVGDAKPFDTERVKDAGMNADFPEHFELEIPAAKYTNNLAIEIEAFNLGLFGKTSLGKTRVPLNSLLPAFNEFTPVAVDLLYDSKKGGPTKQGRVMMRAYLERAVKGSTPTVKDSQPKGSAEGAALPVTATEEAKVSAPSADPQPRRARTVTEAEAAPASKARPSVANVNAPSAPLSAPAGLNLTHYLFVSEIKATGLKSVEMMFGDRNDPYVQLAFGSRWEHRSTHIEGAGSSACWTYDRAKHGDEMRFPVTAEELGTVLMKAVATDKNHMLSDKQIGSGQVKLPNTLVPALDLAADETVTGEVVIPLVDEHGKSSGTVTLKVERQTTVEKAVAPSKPLAEIPPQAAPRSQPAADLTKFKHTLFVSQIRGKGLKNVEMMYGDKNDPYMVVKFGRNTWSCKTSVQQEAGSDPHWDFDFRRDPHMKFAVALEELQSAELGMLRVTAMDKNDMLAHTLIGEGEVALPGIAGCTPLNAKEEVVTFTAAVPLLDKKGKSAGSVELTIERATTSTERKAEPAVVEENAAKKAAGAAQPAKSFDVGTLLVTRIVCQDLPSVELLGGKNDVYVTLQLGAEERKTETIQEGGSNVCFDFLDLAFDVDKSLLDFEQVKVAVTDANGFKSDTLIGRAESSVRFMLQKVDEEGVQLPLQLKNERGKETGKVILFLTLKPAELKAAEPLPLDPSFQGGLLRINRVRAFDLQKPKSMLSGSHVSNPYIKLTFGSWQYKTQPLSIAAAGSPIFDNLDLAAEVTAAMLTGTKLAAEVYEKGMTGDTLVGTGECSVRDAGVKLGEERQFTIDLVNKGATAGKLVVFAQAVQKKQKRNKADVVVDKAFEQGYLQIRAITAHSLKNTELLGKQDPYVVVEFKAAGWKEQTSAQNDAGSDAHWKDLDLRCTSLTRALLLEHDLVVTAVDDNTSRPDALIGSATTSLVEAAAQGVLGSAVDLEVELTDSKGAPAGRIVLQCVVQPEAAKLELASGLSEGVLKVRKIVARGLESGNRFTKSTPAVQLQYGAWESTTGLSEGSDPVWDFLTLESSPPAPAELLRTQPLTINLLEGKKKFATGVIDNMLLAGSQPDTDVEIPVQLLHVKSGVPLGKLTLTLSVGKPSEKIAELASKEEDLPLPTYQEAVLLIHSIKAEGLANTELLGKADPYVSLSLGAWAEQTNVCLNAGGDVVWNDLKIRETFSADLLVHQPMEVTVLDKNQYRKNVVVGRGRLSLKRAAYTLGREMELVVPLQNEKQTKSVGKLVVKLELREQKDPVKVLPADFQEGMLHIFRISAFDLPNKELVGKQDPYVVVKLGDYKDRTPTLPEAGSDPIFDLLDLRTRVTAPILTNRPLEVEVYEDNTVGGHILLGTGSAGLQRVTTVGEEVDLRVSLKDARGESAGRVLLAARLEDMPLPEEKAAAVPISEGFTRGAINIRKICAFGLLNTELFTKQDPFVVVKLGTWAAQTCVKDNAGSDCLWEDLDMQCDVDVPTLQTAAFEVAVMNKNNLRAHKEIGVGKVSIRRAGTQVGQLVELSVNLVNNSSGKAAGRVVLHVEVVPEEDESKYALPPDFAFGQFKVSKISGYNLKNTELLGLPDPYVELTLGDWTAKTYTQDDVPGDVHWNFLALSCDVFRDAVASQMLQVRVMDENKGRAHALIGTGSVSLLKAAAHLGQEVELKVKLQDAQGNNSGRIVVLGTLAVPELIAELPDTFVEGSLRVKRVSAFGLKNTEMLVFKGDPFVRLKLNSFQADTKVLNNAGENPVWKSLDLQTACDLKTVKAGKLTVEAWEKNTMFNDKLLCSCELPLKLAGGKLGQEVELVGKLVTAKGEDRGTVNVLVQLDPIAALSAPDLGLPAGFTVGTVKVIKVQAVGLQNRELLGDKQDPYVCLSVGDWAETTDTLANAGSNATWTKLDMVAEVNADILGNEKLAVRVMDENTSRQDSVLGVGTTSLRKLCARLNSPVEMSVDLAAENGAAVGRVVVTAVLSEGKLEDMNEALPVSAVVVSRAQLFVRRIVASDLRGGDRAFFGNKQDPYILLSLDSDWSAQTEVRKNAGRSAEWPEISDMEVPVTGDILKYKSITVTAMDKNSLAKDAFIGRGQFSLRKLGSQAGTAGLITHVVRLRDLRGKLAGKVTVEAELLLLPDIAEGSKDPATAAAAVDLQTTGMLNLLDCSVSKLRDTGLAGKQDLQVNVALPGWKKSSTVNKGAGTESSWSLKLSSAQVAVAQVLQPGAGLAVEVVGTSAKGSVLLGQATIPLDKAVAQPGKWVDLWSDLKTPGASSASGGGKIRVKACFVVGQGTDLLSNAGNAFGDQGMQEFKTSQAELHNRVGHLEESFRAQLHKELTAERDSILQAMAQQNKTLSASIDKLSKELQKERQSKGALLDGLVVSQVNALKLPADIKQWRSAHVQAWISFQMELPQYAEAFQKASVDGLVLIKHITRDTLQSSLEVAEPMHCQKIMEGVRVLQERQKEVDAQAERERLKRLQAKKEEEERKRAAMAEQQKEAERKAKKDVKAKKKRKAAKVAPKTYFGEVREQNIIERTRIEREMRLYRTEKQKLQEKADQASRTWKFEYTGAPQPKVDTIWDADIFGRQTGSAAYRRSMALDVLGSENFTSAGNPVRAPATMKVRPVPRDCSPEEVLALVKGAMYDVSEWLLEVDRIERRRNAALDSDLRDANDDALLTRLFGGSDAHTLESAGPEERAAGVDEYSLAEFSSEAPPAYDTIVDAPAVFAVDCDEDAGSEGEGEEEYDLDDLPPPAYDDVADEQYADRLLSPSQSPKSPLNAKLRSMIYGGAGDLPDPGQLADPDRMALIFSALVGQQNNNARWLGTNEKLTRMKLYGGFESLLRLKMDWTQFDALWTQLDYKRSGDIDLKEFTAFFGDLAEFGNLMGTQALSTTSKSKSIAALTKCLFELCDALRHAGFTVVEMFSGFDRNGSGGVSMSEFCSMLRLVVGNHFEKRLIYQALAVLDTNGDKNISLEEVLRFVYRVWKSQLEELAEKLGHLDEHMTGDAEKIQKIVAERRLIKEAVKKNFPREWRDRLEREGGHAVPGPFQTLLQRMDVGRTAWLGASSPAQGIDSASTQPHLHAHRTYRPSETWSPTQPNPAAAPPLTASAPLAPRPRSAGGKVTARQLSAAGQNEIMRFKIKVPAGCAPTRQGATLRVPTVRDLSSGPISSSEVTDSLLRKNAPFEGFG